MTKAQWYLIVRFMWFVVASLNDMRGLQRTGVPINGSNLEQDLFKLKGELES